jgi:hypothetical protein
MCSKKQRILNRNASAAPIIENIAKNFMEQVGLKQRYMKLKKKIEGGNEKRDLKAKLDAEKGDRGTMDLAVSNETKSDDRTSDAVNFTEIVLPAGQGVSNEQQSAVPSICCQSELIHPMKVRSVKRSGKTQKSDTVLFEAIADDVPVIKKLRTDNASYKQCLTGD